VVLVARRADRLDALATELRNAHGVRAETVPCDLADAGSRDGLASTVAELGLTVELLVSNAGFGMGGLFADQDPARTQQMVRTNVEATIALCHDFVPGMIARRRGGVVIVSSTTAFQPMSGFSAYAATKAALLSFAEGLHGELVPHGVTVTAVCPGPVDTEFNEMARTEGIASVMPRFLSTSSRDVAKIGLEALDRGRRVVIPRLSVRLFTVITAHIPHGVGIAMWRVAFQRFG
jgi:short-subunit dehydrogenase